MEGCRSDCIFHRPVNCASKSVLVIIVQSKDKASVYHNAKIVQPSYSSGIVPRKVLCLVALGKVFRRKSFKANKNAS